MEIGRHSLNSGLPKQLTLTGIEVREMLQKEVELIAKMVQQTLEKQQSGLRYLH